MPNRKTPSPKSLRTRQEALAEIKSRLETRIHDEHRRPLPDISRLSHLKRLKLRTKDEISSIQALMRALDRCQRHLAS
ncbi:DUF465 domain-containing protein [Tateyamaria armeniaca]|uniref:DUF465 domain-containing protein n=1 Tax=Tateyamaria armeniaca TaxID=2518930 RepID=A0ABW8V056_9RHOB